ncbi:MAG: hypothetical protein M0P91_11275 [Sulfuricurvum sp.]|jgi:hypothetical protein|uniref:hypothetical protein n=1 Tax=Sulfuricurvum sp. TaxID=2025608 RepID=UPI0025DFAA54|nr:hypothetical protein [Sulfuricurvum sp.]MCK9373772.1 hypothetical protein [Sulfuricurvum sp.]
MGYWLWLSVVIVIFGIMHYFTELDIRQKAMISLAVALVVSGAILYNIRSDQERAQVTDIELKYRHGERVVCQGIEVNGSEFSYSDGTQSFIGNKGTSHYQQIFNLRECR